MDYYSGGKMKDKNTFANHYSNYGIIYHGNLPSSIKDEICDNCPGNDSGRIINPKCYPLLKEWLQENDMPVEPYIIWWSW